MQDTMRFGSTLQLFENEISNAMIARKTFDSDWFNSDQGKRKIAQVFNEGLSFGIGLSELELWCKGWVSQNKAESHNPNKVAQLITEH